MKLNYYILNCFSVLFFLLIAFAVTAQTNTHHVQVTGYYRSNGSYVQPYFRTAPNSTNRDNFSTKKNINPYTGKPGWIEPDNKYNTFYYNTYNYTPNDSISSSNLAPPQIAHKDRTYIEDEKGNYSCYLKVNDIRTFNIYDMQDNLILYLVINHRGDWRIFNSNWIYIKTIFVTTEK